MSEKAKKKKLKKTKPVKPSKTVRALVRYNADQLRYVLLRLLKQKPELITAIEEIKSKGVPKVKDAPGMVKELQEGFMDDMDNVKTKIEEFFKKTRGSMTIGARASRWESAYFNAYLEADELYKKKKFDACFALLILACSKKPPHEDMDTSYGGPSACCFGNVLYKLFTKHSTHKSIKKLAKICQNLHESCDAYAVGFRNEKFLSILENYGNWKATKRS